MSLLQHVATARTMLEGDTTAPPKLAPLKPNKVSADIKKGLGGAAAGKYQPQLGNVKFGVNASKLNAYYVMVSPELSAARDMSADEVAAHWKRVLDVLVAAGYTLVANVLDKSSRIMGGPEAYKVAAQNQIVAVVRSV